MFVGSAGIAGLVNLVQGLNLRASKEAELLGMDEDQLGEFAYNYVEVRKDYLAWTPAAADTQMLDGSGVDQSPKIQGEALRVRHLNENAGQVLSMDGELTLTTVGMVEMDRIVG